MTFTNRTAETGNFENRTDDGYTQTVGDTTEEEFIELLGSAPTFETPVPQAGGAAFGDLAFDDVMDMRDRAFTNRTGTTTEWTNQEASL